MAIYKQGQPTNNHGQTQTNLYKHGRTQTDTDGHGRTRTDTDGHGRTRTDMYKLGRIITSASPRHCICSLSALFRFVLAYLLGGLTFLPICHPHSSILALMSHHKTHCIDDLSDAQGMTCDTYLAVLKGSTLSLYEYDAMQECAAAIDVPGYGVRVYGELFAKRNALVLRERENDADGGLVSCTSRYAAYDTAAVPTRRARIPIASLDATPDHVSTRWLNPFLGRLFLSVIETTMVKAWAIVKTPSFLKSVVVRSFTAGSVAPFYSKPMLKELTPDGEPASASTFPTPHCIGDHLFIQCSDLLPLCEKDKDGNVEKKQDTSYEVGLVLAVVMKKLVTVPEGGTTEW
ncbi:hypothetical protein M422DRAFT_263435 [Sphaerobolus stellatus SS14]|uniref:Uncharacterized protein n=1 Tax=Sphaerobolus stellatus (strain SS14) TaxID=990650 RepID=A0A0C9UHY5_SPHS4|nr:hypothetical protein M422DRAFT_263435 [Sphaerobolus stellatus SS14]